MSKIRSFANNKIKRHNSSSTKTYVITLYIHFSHRDKNSVMAPKNLNTLMFTNLISNIQNGSTPRMAPRKYWGKSNKTFLPMKTKTC